LKRVDGAVKQKSQASADFLGVWRIHRQVAETLLHSDNNFDPVWSKPWTGFSREVWPALNDEPRWRDPGVCLESAASDENGPCAARAKTAHAKNQEAAAGMP
jgi:hypothetical protein